MVEVGHASLRDHANARAISVSPVDGHLLDAMVRVARLLEAPDEAPVLLPLLTREMIYRLLRGEQGARLSHLAILGVTPPPSPERSNGSVKISTSNCASRAWRKKWA
jgi:hypothetical protein